MTGVQTCALPILDPKLKYYTPADLLDYKNFYNKQRDLSIICLTGLYILNILDATVDAHLWHFEQNISDDLSFRLRPTCIPAVGHAMPVPGLGVGLSFH